MKQVWVLLTCVFFLSAIAGCQQHPRYSMSPGTLEVFIEGDGEFPEFLVGKWKGDRGGWEFVFEPDGTISEAIIAMGRTKIIPGEKTILSTAAGGTAGIIKGSVTFANGLVEGGDYEVRLFFDNSYKSEATAEFSVVSPSSSSMETVKRRATAKSRAASSQLASVKTDKSVYSENEPIKVDFSNASGDSQDWIGLYVQGAANDVPIDWLYTDGRKSGEAVYVPGDWLVIYSPADRSLTVDVVMDYVRVEMGGSVLQGKEKNVLVGTVSEDGKMWQVTVNSFPEYEGFPTDPNDLPYIRQVIFTKVTGEI